MWRTIPGNSGLREHGFAVPVCGVGGIMRAHRSTSQAPRSGCLDELYGEPARSCIAGEWPVKCPERGVEFFGEDDVGGVVCALALEPLGQRDYGRGILERVKHNWDRGYALAGPGALGGGKLAGSYSPGERAGNLVGEKLGRV